MSIQFTKIRHDINGNPRYVVHYTNLLTKAERGQPNEFVYSLGITINYLQAIARAHKIGGRKYHTKNFGGGIVFQSYSLAELERAILQVVEQDEIKASDTESTDES